MQILYRDKVEIKISSKKGISRITDDNLKELMEQLRQFCNKHGYEINELSVLREKI